MEILPCPVIVYDASNPLIHHTHTRHPAPWWSCQWSCRQMCRFSECHPKVSSTIASFKTVKVYPYTIFMTGSILSAMVFFNRAPMLVITRRNLSTVQSWHLSCHRPPLPTCQVCNKGVGVIVPVHSCCQPLLMSWVMVDLFAGRPFGGIPFDSLM
jgi:hypothetical protein